MPLSIAKDYADFAFATHQPTDAGKREFDEDAATPPPPPSSQGSGLGCAKKGCDFSALARPLPLKAEASGSASSPASAARPMPQAVHDEQALAERLLNSGLRTPAFAAFWYLPLNRLLPIVEPRFSGVAARLILFRARGFLASWVQRCQRTWSATFCCLFELRWQQQS